jgi:hypothetical protein
VFHVAFSIVIVNSNILVGFRGASLVLYKLERVLLKSNITLYTPIPVLIEATL